MSIFKKSLKQSLCLLGCFLLTHCFETGFREINDEIIVLRAMSAEIILVRYELFESLSQELSDTINELCEAPSESTLIAAQEVWWSARAPWKRSEVINFGPVREYPLRLGPKLDKWPVNEQAIEELIAAREVTTQEQFSALGGATRGLPMIEYLLWYKRSSETVLERLQNTRRCEVLTLAGEDVARSSRQLSMAWRDEGWLELTKSSNTYEAPFANEDEIITELVNRMAFTVENIRVDKFEKPLGDFEPGSELPDIIESRFSLRSIEDARDAFQGIAEVWHGTNNEEVRNGLKYIITSLQVIDLVNVAIEDTRLKLAALEVKLTELPIVQPNELKTAIESLTNLQRIIQTDLSQVTQATIRFNDTDGD